MRLLLSVCVLLLFIGVVETNNRLDRLIELQEQQLLNSSDEYITDTIEPIRRDTVVVTIPKEMKL